MRLFENGKISGSPALVMLLDQNLEIRQISDHWRTLAGFYKPSEQPTALAELFDLTNNSDFAESLAGLFISENAYLNLSADLLVGKGVIPALISIWQVQDAESKQPLLMLMALESKKSDSESRALQTLKAQHEVILDAAGEGIYGLDANGCVTFSNAAATKILGWECDKILGQPAHDVHHHSHEDGSPYAKIDCPIYAALKDGEVHRVENEVFWHTNGKPIPVAYVSTPIMKDGKPDGAVIVFRDDSKRRQIELERQQAFAKLDEAQQAHHVLLNAAGEGIYGLDSNGLITFSNDAATAILGWKNEDVLGKSSHEVHHHSHQDGSNYPREQCPIYAAITDGEVHHVEDEVFWHTNGTPVPVEYTSTPILRDGKPDGAVVVFKDVSARKKLERQKEQALAEVTCLKEKLEQERDYLREEVISVGNFREIIGESDALKRTLAQVEAVAKTPASVLILGESGVGKELIARAIHNKSVRADMQMVKVNCASIPNELFESEFFGHVKGSFTGAHQDRMGRLELADGGTLFLDEVGEIPLSQQGKLLRALQENEFERVGDHKTSRVNVRVLAATNRNLEEEIKAGRFREDLYYRLSVFPIEVPPLRKRNNDVIPIALSFLESACREMGKDVIKLSRSNAEQLKRYTWPGNIRELKNTIDRAVISSTNNKLRLDLALQNNSADQNEDDLLVSESDSSAYLTSAEFKALEKANIIAALKQANWKTWGDEGAAALLGIKASTLAYQMKIFDIKKPTA